MDGLVERMNQTFKTLFKKAPNAFPRQWDLDPLFFALREAPQFSTGLLPFDLLYDWKPHSLLQNLQEGWASPDPGPANSPLTHIQRIQEWLAWGRQTVATHLQAAEASPRSPCCPPPLPAGRPSVSLIPALPTISHLGMGRAFTVTQVLGPLTKFVAALGLIK